MARYGRGGGSGSQSVAAEKAEYGSCGSMWQSRRPGFDSYPFRHPSACGIQCLPVAIGALRGGFSADLRQRPTDACAILWHAVHTRGRREVA